MNELAREPSIGDYAAIGDCRTLALVSRFGSIDWCCLPDFPSPSIFAALLDRERGGRYALTPRGITGATQHYLARTNVLRTRIECERGVLQLTDFMTGPETSDEGQDRQEIVRIAECVAGTVELDVRFDPRPDYAQVPARLHANGARHWTCASAPGGLALHTSFALAGDEHSLSGSIGMRAGEVHASLLV